MGARLVVIVLISMLIPIVIPSGVTVVDSVTAASPCDGGDFVLPQFNTTVERLAKIPTVYDYFPEDDRDGGGGGGEQDGDDQPGQEEYDGPEETWMTWSPDNDLSLLRDDFQTMMLIGEDAVGTLRVNLDYQRRTTVCVTIETTNNSYDPTADVYLMTDSQYDRYTAAYDRAHGAWDWGGFDSDEDVSDVSPEWRSFDILGWNTFRDSHKYEDVKDVSFTLSLDGPEVSSGLFGGEDVQYFNIVIDNTNNSHRHDALPETTIAAYVSVVSEERSTILPNWTVSVVCCGLMMATIVIPLITNKRYMAAGLSLVSENQQMQQGLVPSLEQKTLD
ncbi:MAG: hypothetical protein HOM85_03790 [Euryarchaeota archaeon]|nr:hypothetical protein [Euryarchaeota archaeon]